MTTATPPESTLPLKATIDASPRSTTVIVKKKTDTSFEFDGGYFFINPFIFSFRHSSFQTATVTRVLNPVQTSTNIVMQ
jgi:hypothetical protein